jgi:hypothetical protein
MGLSEKFSDLGRVANIDDILFQSFPRTGVVDVRNHLTNYLLDTHYVNSRNFVSSRLHLESRVRSLLVPAGGQYHRLRD